MPFKPEVSEGMPSLRAGYPALESDAVTIVRGNEPVQVPLWQLNDHTTGWGLYSDTQYTSGSAFAVSGNTDTLLPNNAGTVIESQKPRDVETFYRNGKITGRNGDGLLVAITMHTRPTNASTEYMDLWLDVGGSVGEIFRRTVPFPKGSGVEHSFSTTISCYTLDTWQQNGAAVYVRAPGPLDVYDIQYVITRTHKAR